MSTDGGEMSDTPEVHDRRSMLKKVGITGAAVAGAWVAPQVLFESPARAGCTPITKTLQIDAASCTAQVTTFPSAPEPTSCYPSGWVNGSFDGIGFTCAANSYGGTITIAGCTPVSARAVRYCVNASGSKYTCVSGSISGQNVTFPAISPTNPQACVYLTFRITVSCCA